MKNNSTSARRRGFAVGLIILAVGVAAAANRFVTLDATTNSLFFISLFASAAGIAIMIRVARRDTEPKEHFHG